jgi:hypothetical protein
MAEAAHSQGHRDKKIGRKHGNTLVRTLRKTCGAAAAQSRWEPFPGSTVPMKRH